MSKARKLYILVGIILSMAVPIIVLDLREGYLFSAGFFSFTLAGWSVLVLYLAWKLSRSQETDKPQHITEVTPRHRHLRLLEKTLLLFILLFALALLFIVITGGIRPYLALKALLLIIISCVHLFYFSLVPDK